MSYDELVRFAKWMQRNGKHTPYVWVNKQDVLADEEDYLNFDGVVYPEDVKAFNEHELTEET